MIQDCCLHGFVRACTKQWWDRERQWYPSVLRSTNANGCPSNNHSSSVGRQNWKKTSYDHVHVDWRPGMHRDDIYNDVWGKRYVRSPYGPSSTQPYLIVRLERWAIVLCSWFVYVLFGVLLCFILLTIVIASHEKDLVYCLPVCSLCVFSYVTA